MVCECSPRVQVEEWRAGSSMKTCRSAMSVVARQDEVFIIGGYDGASSLNTMEVYVSQSCVAGPCVVYCACEPVLHAWLYMHGTCQ